ncbi:MAG TPA: hypothetical protein VH583_09420 [Vicinamibacterales bacterium]|jgi:hypothetical protein
MPPIRSLVAQLATSRPGIDVVRQPVAAPLLIDRGSGLLYDVERNITWLQDANYAKTVGRTADGQLNWYDAQAWVAGLSYRGITGWRLPDARAADGSGPREGENSADGEIGHLFLVAGQRTSPEHLQLTNFQPYTIYWYRNEASSTEAYAYKLVGLRQGRLAKDPWGGDLPVPLTDQVLAWPVHDGDVRPSLLFSVVSRVRTAFTGRTDIPDSSA